MHRKRESESSGILEHKGLSKEDPKNDSSGTSLCLPLINTLDKPIKTCSDAYL